MPLMKDTLKTQLDAIQKSNPPSVVVAATQWSTAIYAYSSTALAGPLIPVLVPVSLQASFLVSLNKSTFIDDLGQNLLTWWSSAIWNGPRFCSSEQLFQVLL